MQAKIYDQLSAIEHQLLLQQMKPPKKQNQNLQKVLSHQHRRIILAKQEAFHRQRYKKTSPPMSIEVPPSFTTQ